MKSSNAIKQIISFNALTAILLTHNVGFASIPDDIDVEKYRSIYSNSKQISDSKRAIADEIDDEINITVSEIDATKNDISKNQADVSELDRYIDDLKRENVTLGTEIDKLDSDIRHNERSIRTNRSEIQNIKSELVNVNADISQISQRYNKVLRRKRDARARLNQILDRFNKQKDRLSNLRSKKQNLEQQISNKQNRVQKITQEIQNLKSFKENINTIQSNLRTKISNLKTKKQNQESLLSTNKTKRDKQAANLQRVKSEVSQLKNQADIKRQEIRRAQKSKDPDKQAKVAALKAEFKTIKDKLDKKRQRQQKIQSNLAATQKTIQNLKSRISSISSKIQSAKNELQSNKSKIDQVEPKIARLKTKRQSLKNELPGLKQEKVNVVSKLQKVRSNHEETRRRKIESENELTDINRRLDKVSARLNQAERQKEHLKKNMRSLKLSNNRMLDENIEFENRIERNRDRIVSNDNAVVRSEREIISLERIISRLKTELARLETKERNLRSEFAVADDEASSAERNTQNKYSKYLSVKGQYDSEISQARQDGESQGQGLGSTAGVEPGKADGKKAGQLEGENFGTQEGLLIGYIDGLVVGKEEGKKAGYKHGVNLPENYSKGYEQGYKQGIENAKAIAKRENYFPTRAKLKKELLSAALSKAISVDNGTAQGKKLFKLFNDVLNNQDRSPSTGNMIPSSLSLDNSWDGLLALIEEVQVKINSIPKKAVIDRNTGVVTFPIQTDIKKASCEKRYIDFTNACKSSFVSGYKSGFKASYKESFVSVKVGAFLKQRELAIEKSQDKRIQEGRQYASPIAYAHWDKIGADEARNSGMQDGLKEGEEQNIDKERQAAVVKGTQDEQDFFAQNPVLRVRSVNFKKVKDGKNTEVIAGDEILLSAVITNHGAKASQRGQAKLKWEALTNNVIVDSSLQPIVGIDGKTKANVSSIAYAKIDPMAVLSEVVKIKVTAYMPDGEVQEKIIEFKTKQHLNTQIQANVEKSIPESFETQFVLVKVFNNSKVNSPKNIKAVMSFGGYRGADKGKVSHNYGNLKSRATGSKMFTYSLNRRANVGDRFQVIITVYFGDQVSAKKVYNVKVEVDSDCEDFDDCD